MARISACINCGKQPVIVEQEGEYRFLLKHKEECYPTFCLETHQHTKKQCIEDWNKYNKYPQER